MPVIDIFKRVLLLLVFCLVQVLVLNRIHLLECATPLLYVYFVMGFPRNYPKWGVLLWSFVLGFILDTFSNTPGVSAASLTLIAAIQPYFFNLFIQQDAPDDMIPSVASIGWGKYSFYAFVLVLLYSLVFFTLETFSFFNWLQWIECVTGSALLTLILILTLENVKK
jgi:rod shape-determining protein MreD